MQELVTQVEKIWPGAHMVALNNKEKEIVDNITSYIGSALKRKERCIYITGDADTSAVLQQLGDLSDGSASGDYRTNTYSREGERCPDKLILMIKSMVEAGLNDGYKTLALTEEIGWVLHKKMISGIIMTMLKLPETYDPYTKNHCLNVASLAKKLAESLNMAEEYNTKNCLCCACS